MTLKANRRLLRSARNDTKGFDGSNMTLKADRLTFHYPNGRGVQEVTFTLERGQSLGLLGPNGSGKSTLLRLLCGLLTPTGGALHLWGQAAPPVPATLRSRIGVLFDAPAHFDDLTGRENAAFFAAAYGLSPQQTAERLLPLAERLGLADRLDDRLSDYSFGMRRKLALIEILLPQPDLLLLDEPGAGLDYAAQAALHDILAEHCRRGGMLVLATNQVPEAQTVCERVLFLHAGQPVALDTPAALLAGMRRGSRVTLRLEAPIPLEPLAALPTVQQVSAAPQGEVVLLSRDGRHSVAQIVNAVHRAGGALTSLAVDAPTLGDVFLALTGRPLEGDEP
ncbi:MAG: ABC transporter ATP-binding protein [Anaerolineales bacterium]